MTPERCVELAQEGAWRYVGLEYSSECFVGNTIYSTETDPKNDCDMVCSRDDGKLCGGGNRLQVYEDSTWEDPTLEELADGIRQYNASVYDTLQVIFTYNDHLTTLQDILESSSCPARAKRTDSPYEEIKLQVRNDQNAAEKASTDLVSARAAGQRLLQLGRQLDTLNEDDPNVPFSALDDFQSVDSQITAIGLPAAAAGAATWSFPRDVQSARLVYRFSSTASDNNNDHNSNCDHNNYKVN
ncbi:hypothetical protein BDV12DRAFT_196174 [Aspergillus spectabilis]